MSFFCNQPRRYLSALKPYEKYTFAGANIKPSLTIQNHHIDTTVWDNYTMNDNDIFINTPAKCGTTWMQEICGQLLYNGNYEKLGNIGNLNHDGQITSIQDISPWFTMFGALNFPRFYETFDAQLENKQIKHRLIKTHEPVETKPFNKNCKYIFVGRDYRDIVWSFYRHYKNFTNEAYELFNAPKKYEFTPLPKLGDKNEYDLWNMMLFGDENGNGLDAFGYADGYPLWSQLMVAGSWWNIKHLSNVKFIHYNEMINDLAKIMREIAQFLEIEIDESNFDNLVENCTFDSMKENVKVPSLIFKEPKQFFYKGQNKQWLGILNENDFENYRSVAKKYLDDDGIYWLENGTNK